MFFNDATHALSSGFRPCAHCDPTGEQGVDIDLIKLTIDNINASIGFTTDPTDLKKRAFSTPSVSTVDGHYNDRQLTRNESEHIKLVELACRHIASAAAENVSKQQEQEKDKRKKRRGGVLGFKELASKSKLSPWHFHRVFKSVTGLTPKSYGDQCWKFIKNHERPQNGRTRSHFRSNSDITNNYNNKRRVKRESGDLIPPKQVKIETMPQVIGNVAPMLHQQQQLHHQQQDLNVESTPQFSDPLSFNTSLDINIVPMRHYSLDMGVMGSLQNMDLSDVMLSPQFNNNQQHHHAMTPSLPMGPSRMTGLSTMPPFQYQQPTPPQMSIVPNDTDGDSSSPSVVNGASLSLCPDDSSVWPSIEVSTPPEEASSNNSTNENETTFYDVLVNSSPLDSDHLFQISDYPVYAPFQNGGVDPAADSTMLFGGDEFMPQLHASGSQDKLNQEENALFDGITMLKHEGNLMV